MPHLIEVCASLKDRGRRRQLKLKICARARFLVFSS